MTDARALAVKPIPWQTAKVVAVEPRTPRIKSFYFDLPQPFAFAAGQHVDVRLTAPDGYRAQRSYSIASAPDDSGRIELAIELLDTGEVSAFFHEVVAVGDPIELRGPLGGYFVWPPAERGPVLLIGGGSGLVPLMSMIRHRAAAGSHVPVLLLLSARTWDDILYRDELLALDAREDGFTLVLTLTREPPRRPGDYGRRVDAAMMHDVLAKMPSLPAIAFVCGTNPFVDVAADGTVAAGVPAADVRTERYGA
ncbi:MAG TPA: ferredoxin reductase [Candidatus Sulfotelmatobacter sp.]|nr:ferredoxin reductase [Candidatus Sulfotelmatobacter sp.]